MVGFSDRPKRASFVESDGKDDFRERIDGVEIDARDLGGVDIERDVADGVLTQRWMFAAGADNDGDIKPLASFHGFRGGDFGRMLGIEGAAQCSELRGELLFLAGPYRVVGVTEDQQTESKSDRQDKWDSPRIDSCHS